MNEPNEPYRVTFEERQKYLYSHIEADRTDRPLALEYWETIIEKCRELRTKRLLVYQDIAGGLSLTDTFAVAGEIAAMVPQGLKIAFVDPHIVHYETHEFGQLVASNRGLWAQVFTTLPEAENWLL